MSPSNEPAIIVKEVRKSFRIPLDKVSGIKQIIVNMFKRKKGYREFNALNGVSFEIQKGEFFGIVGRNGSGKSTLLKILAGVYTPDSGGVAVNGTLTPFIELGVGFNPELSGRENVFLNGALLGFSRNEMEAMYDEIVDFAELHDFMEERLKNYSSGMQVRLAFSIAIRARSDILLLDEVLAVGDAGFQKKCFDYFAELKKDNRTVILVTHDMESVRKFCNRALLLADGVVVRVGSANEISDEYIKQNIKNDAPHQKADEETIHIKGVNLLGEDGSIASSFQPGDLSTIEVVIEPIIDDEIVNVGIGLHSPKYGQVFGYNTQMDDYKVAADSQVVRLDLKDCNLLPGEYYINVVYFSDDESDPFEYRSEVARFVVNTDDDYKGYRGVVHIEHIWRDDEK